MKILGVPLNTSSFISSFIKYTLFKDVRHVDLLLRFGDVHVTFGILIHYFVQWPSYLLHCTPSFFIFINSIVFFYLSFLQVFRCFLGWRSFDSLERVLAHKLAFFPITFNGIRFILTTTIALTTYLGSWALVASIIVARFMVNQHPCLFEAFTQVDNYPFQRHFKSTCDLLPFQARACFPPFKQLIGQQMVHLQNSI
jgi:hypothetical protein